MDYSRQFRYSRERGEELLRKRAVNRFFRSALWVSLALAGAGILIWMNFQAHTVYYLEREFSLIPQVLFIIFFLLLMRIIPLFMANRPEWGTYAVSLFLSLLSVYLTSEFPLTALIDLKTDHKEYRSELILVKKTERTGRRGTVRYYYVCSDQFSGIRKFRSPISIDFQTMQVQLHRGKFGTPWFSEYTVILPQ